MIKYIRDNFKKFVNFTLILLAGQWVFSKAIYAITIRGPFMQMSLFDYLYGRAIVLLCTYDIVCVFLLCLFYAYITSHSAEHFNRIKEAMKAPGFKLSEYFADLYLTDNIYRIAIFAIIQLPYTVFYAFFGFSFEYSMRFESFFRLEAGIYLATEHWLIGFVASMALFSLALFASQFIFLYSKYKITLSNAPEGFYDHLKNRCLTKKEKACSLLNKLFFGL